MQVKSFTRTLSLISALAVAPVFAVAASPKECQPGPPTAESYQWNFQREASQLLQGIQEDAMNAQDHANLLENFDTNLSVSWRSHAGELTAIKHEVNDMGQKLCRLETIRTALAPWQQKAVDRVAPDVRLMADNVQDAILFLNHNQNTLWLPTYRKYAKNLYQEASTLSQSVKSYEEYAKAHREDLNLGKQLGLSQGM
jgi:hypothetical protein